MKIKEILIEISNKGKIYDELLNANNSDNVNEIILSKLSEDYETMNSSSFNKANLIKEVRHKVKTEKINEIFDLLPVEYNKKNIVISKINGPYKQPDFIVLEKFNQIKIEIKFNKSKSAKVPVWNSVAPNYKTLYIFINANNLSGDITFFKGSDFIKHDDVLKMNNLVNEYKNILKNEGSKINTDFSLYLRPMYVQKGNIFSNINRDKLEKTVINSFI